MLFKEHPYYDESEREDWLDLQFLGDVPILFPDFAPIIEVVRDDKKRLCDLGLQRIKEHVGKDYLVERPYPNVNEVLFRPTANHGFQVYIEYFFFQKPKENSPDSDFWWIIVNCPYAIPPFPTGKRDYYVIGLGWLVR